MTMAATTPTAKDAPRLAVTTTGEPLSDISVSEVTVKDRHPTRPDLYTTVSIKQ